MRISDWSSDVCSSDLFHAERRHNDWPVDEDRMFDHRINELVIAERRIGKTQLGEGRALLAEQLACADAYAGDERNQARAVGRRLEIFAHLRLDPGVADNSHGVEPRPTPGVVVVYGIDC